MKGQWGQSHIIDNLFMSSTPVILVQPFWIAVDEPWGAAVRSSLDGLVERMREDVENMGLALQPFIVSEITIGLG